MFTLEPSPFEFTSGAEVRLPLLSYEVVPGASASRWRLHREQPRLGLAYYSALCNNEV